MYINILYFIFVSKIVFNVDIHNNCEHRFLKEERRKRRGGANYT